MTAMCTNCHTAHGVLPRKDPASSINPANVPGNMRQVPSRHRRAVPPEHSCRFIEGEAGRSCRCATIATVRMRSAVRMKTGFKLTIMTQCGRCHEEIARTYFDTYHGKVSQLGYTGTAKCYDCHGAHDIQAVVGSAFASEPGECGGHVSEVPCGCQPAVRRVSDPCHASRSEQVSRGCSGPSGE